MTTSYEICKGTTLESLHKRIKHVTDGKVTGATVKVLKINEYETNLHKQFEALVELTWDK